MSDNNNVQVRSGGIGFAGMLAILFIGLKLTNYIDWSWWWVLSPLWIPLAVVLGILAVIGAVILVCWATIGVCSLFEKKPQPPRNKYRGL